MGGTIPVSLAQIDIPAESYSITEKVEQALLRNAC
jgi:hypothetical protein